MLFCIPTRHLFRSIGSLLLSLAYAACASHTQPTHRSLTQEAEALSHADHTPHEAVGSRYAISTQGQAATRSAQRMFEQGGNAIDAAIAASFAISVERPQSTGLGGGGFLLFYEAKTKKTYAVDFRERAPLRSKPDLFLDRTGEVIPGLSSNGILSTAVPGLVAGLLEVHSRFGSLPLPILLQPAIDLAEKGFAIYPSLAEALADQKGELAKYPASRKIFLKANGRPLGLGETLVQRDLASTLRHIAQSGRAGFYSGAVGKAMVQESRRLHGILSAQDLQDYAVRWREPIHGSYKNFEIASMPPPSSGGTHVLEVLNLLEGDALGKIGFHHPRAIHLTASALQQAFADRARYMGDPDFGAVPSQALASKAYASKMRQNFAQNHARPAAAISAGEVTEESKETTHFSIIDLAGNAVASTQTINAEFGSGIVVPGTGIVLNNEMDDFSAKPGASNHYGAIGGKPNAIAPKKTPLSSMSPTLVFRDGQVVMAVGAPGGTRIISCVAQVLLNYLEYGLPLYESIAAIRFHHQWKPDEISIDAPGFSAETQQALREMGYTLRIEPNAVFCRVMAVAREGAQLHAVSDPRDAGSSAGH